MSARSSSDSSWSRRKALFALTAIRSADSSDSGGGGAVAKLPRALKKSRPGRASPGSLDLARTTPAASEPELTAMPALGAPPKSQSALPSLNMRAVKQKHLRLDSFKSSGSRSTTEESGDAPEPMSAASSAPSLKLDYALEGVTPSKTVLLHGEVQTSAGMFRKKKEYLVLTEVYIIRYKSQARAADMFKTIPPPMGRSPTIRHGSTQSIGSQSDLQSMSDSSGEKDGKVTLRQVVATYKLDDGKPWFSLELCYLDEDSGQASALVLQFTHPEERDHWLKCIRTAVRAAHERAAADISPFNLENAARIVERENDYDPSNCAIYKVVQRHSASKHLARSSSDDLSKVAATVCFLAIGVHKVHLVQLVKPVLRVSTPSLPSSNAQASHGTLTLSAIRASGVDDTFELTFRQPLQSTKTLYLASTSSADIVARLYFAENYLRPAYGQRLFRWNAPPEFDDLLAPTVSSDDEAHACLDRTLIAYCIAYGVNPTNVRYTINYHCEDSPRFELLPPVDARRRNYGPLELLAIMRALRYNESFGSISFAGSALDCLNGLHDNYGNEMVCWRTKKGSPIKMSLEELERSSLLVQEVRALAATSKRLRRMDFSGCISTKQWSTYPAHTEIGCGIVEALIPLCKHQTTNVDWICLNGIELCDCDLDYFVGAAVDKSCHFRAIELNRCGLGDRSMGLILDALRAQENTLEALEIAGNTARLTPAAFDSQLSIFGFIRKLNLSHVSLTSGMEPLLQADTLLIWRLQELRLSGSSLNAATISALTTYLAHPQSATLRELYVDNSFLSGNDVAKLLNSLAREGGEAREMHIDISQSQLGTGLEQVTEAIAKSITPTHLTMRAIEYREESAFRKMLAALTSNKTIRFLDMSQTALPGDAGDETCRALERLLAENDVLIELNISGDDSRLASSKFGPGVNGALAGLKKNKTMKVFHIEKQKLRLPGASALAEVLRENRTLVELYCGDNEIPLHGLTDLVNALIENTVLVHLPPMDDGRAAAFRDAEATMKVMSDLESLVAAKDAKTSTFKGESMVRRGFASVRRTAQRSSTSTSPSFPALSSYGRSPTSPDTLALSPSALTLPPLKNRQSSQGAVAASAPPFTVQDVQITHRLLTEQWDRQCYRLGQYLERNWCLTNGLPCNMEIEDEKFERPGSVGSIGKILEQVKYDTTPRVEKDDPFGADLTETATTTTLADGGKHAVSFKQFLLGSEPSTPSSPVDEFSELDLGQMRLDPSLSTLSEPQTPTQHSFTAQI